MPHNLLQISSIRTNQLPLHLSRIDPIGRIRRRGNMNMVRVKICGITTPDDARLATVAGADAIGLNFVGGPRKITPKQAALIVAALPPFCSTVALVNLDSNPLGDELWDAIAHLRIRSIQLYGTNQDRAVAQLMGDGFLPVLVHPVNPDSFPHDFETRLAGFGNTPPLGVVFDTHDPDQMGGTGKTFNWETLMRRRADGSAPRWPHVILAGGLDPLNVAEAVRITQPWAVDVSSGVEVSPGQKSAELMHAFVRAAKGASTTC